MRFAGAPRGPLPQLATALALLLASTPAWANPYEILGIDARSIAMGGAFTAVGGSIASLYHNPAGLAELGRGQFLLGGRWSFPRVSLSRSEAASNPDTASARTVEARGAIEGLDLGMKTTAGTTVSLASPAGRSAGIGMTLHLAGRRGSWNPARYKIIRYQFRDATTPFDLHDGRLDRLVIGPAAGIRLHPRLSAGAGFTILGEPDATLEVAFPLDDQRTVEAASSIDIPPTVTPFAGFLCHATDKIVLGLTWRNQTLLRIRVHAVTEVNIGMGPLRYPVALPLEVRAATYFAPQEAVLGASYLPTPSLRVTTDLAWAQWSRYVPPFPEIRSVDESVFDSLPESLRPELPQVPALAPAGFKDTLAPRMGIEWLGWERTAVRAGLAYQPSPVPEQQGETNILDTDRLHLSCGLGFTLPLPNAAGGDLHVDAFGRWSRLLNRTDAKDPAGLRDEDPEREGIQTSNPGYPGVTYSGWHFATGLSLTMEL